MSAPSIAAQWVLAGGYVLLGIATSIDWLRHRDQARRYLTLSVALLGVVALISGISAAGVRLDGAVTDVTLVAFSASGWAFLRFRDDLVAYPRRALLAADAGVAAAIVFMLAVFTPAAATARTGALQEVAALVLLAVWAGCVGEPLLRFWRLSRGLPSVQRSRLRALVGAYGGVVVVLVITIVVSLAGVSTAAAGVTLVISLLTVPLFYVAFAPPVWLRRIWREREEEPFRQALGGLLLYSPDRQTLAERAVGWAARLVGADSALIATDDGAVLATHNLDVSEAARLMQGTAQTEALPGGGVVRLRLSSDYISGVLVVRTGPLTPLFSAEEAQRLRGYAAAVTTAMDRVLLVERLRRSAQLIDLAYNPILTYNAKTGLITYWNKAAEHTYGYTAAEAVGRAPGVLLQTKLPVPREAVLDELRARRRWTGEITQVTKSGRILHVHARWALQAGVSGEADTILEINRDMTQEQRMTQALREARDQAERASQAKSEYLSRMSHELRTPLTAILGYSDLLEMRDPRPDQVEAIASIQEASSHLLSLVNDVLDIARIESGREQVTTESVRVGPVLDECLRLIAPAAQQHHVVLQREGEGAETHVHVDRQRLVQAVLNLLSNAVKYSGAGATVTVTTACTEDGRMRIAVRDTGPGLTAEQLQRLFQPFERVGAERTTTPGTGLGLALSKNLVEAMDGSIGVRSQVGEGSEFWLELAVAASEPVERPVVPDSTPVPAATEGPHRTLLYVEDNLSTIGLMEDVFALRPQLRVITALQGSMALALAREHRPDLIVLDLHLPDMGGDEVLRRLRAQPETAAIPVVMFSADATERQRQRLLAAGAQRYLLKPAKVSEFLATLDEVLAAPATPAATAAP